MPQAQTLLGVDIGTSSIKIVALGVDGTLLHSASSPLPTRRLPDGRIEHDGDVLWARTAATIARVASEVGTGSVVGIAVTSMGEAGMLVDRCGGLLGPMISWSDPRTGPQERWWAEQVGAARLYDITGQALDRFFAASKLRWLRDNEPELLSRASHWLSAADLIVLRLSGVVATDRTLASRTMLFDQRTLDWSGELIDLAEIPMRLLPPVHPSGTQVGVLSSTAAELTGLPAGVPVSVGGHDRLCGAFAARAGTDAAVDSIGTAETVVVRTPSFGGGDPADSAHIPCYADVMPGGYAYSARVGWAGGLLEWATTALFGARSADAASLVASLPTPITFSGVVCQHTFARPATPAWDPSAARGAFLGLTTAHDRTHMLQAVLEAGCFSARANISALERITGSRLSQLRLEGGPTRSDTWMQLRADAMGRDIAVVDLPDSTAVGAALLAGVGAGTFRSHEEAAARVRVRTRTFSPDHARAAEYGRVYDEVWSRLPAALGEINRTLTGF